MPSVAFAEGLLCIGLERRPPEATRGESFKRIFEPTEKLVPTGKVGALLDLALFAPRRKVGAYAQSWCLRTKLAPTHKVGAYVRYIV
jgi:hypothetical protein